MDHQFRGRNEAPPLYRNNDGRRPYPPNNNTVQNMQNNGTENIRNQGNWQKREEDKYTRNLNMQGARRAPPSSGIKN
jgi:hypothetical protein